MSRFLNSRYLSLNEYVPGEQPRDRKYIKLNTNESPFSPSKGVLEAINADEASNLRLYCDPTCKALKEKIAGAYGFDSSNVYLANGSDDILNFAFAAFGEKGVVFPEISYGFYEVFAELHGINAETIPLESDFSVDLKRYYGKSKLVVIANPNAPTGIFIDKDKIEKLVKSNSDSVVLIDEAYIDFGGESAISLVKSYDNLLVVRTFSKSFSMAGARLGYAFGNKEIIKDLEKLKYSTNPYNVNTLSQKAGIAAIDDFDYYMNNCRKIIKNREYTENELKKLGFTFTDSKANFIFVKSDKISGEDLYLTLKEKGILVRHFTKEKIKDYNRITIGSMEEMEKLICAIKEISKERAWD